MSAKKILRKKLIFKIIISDIIAKEQDFQIT